MTELKAAVIGVGYLGNFHAQKYVALAQEKFKSKVSLVAVSDVSAEQGTKVAHTLGVAFVSDLKQLCSMVDLVTIASTSSTHYDLSKACLSAGLHVNVEKPMVLKSIQAEELLRIAEKNNLVFCVGHSERFGTAYRHWRERLGIIESLEFERHAPYKERGTDVSVLHDLMIHDLDLAMDLNDFVTPRVVWARAGKVVSQTWDWGCALLQWPSGKTAWISSSRVSPVMIRRARGLGPEGLSSLDFQTGAAEFVSRKTSMLPQTDAIGKSDNLLFETENFIASVLGEEKPLVPATQAAASIRLLEEIEAWFNQNRS
jgi:predicted dehydrogenase